LALLLLVLGALACRERAAAPSPSSDVDLPSASVRKPSGVVAEVFVDRPAETWSRLRALLAPARLPEGYAGLLANALELPSEAAAAIREQAPVFGVLLAQTGQPALVIALPLESGAKLLATLTTGRAATYGSARDPASRIAVLRKLEEPVQSAAVLGVVGNVLLVARSSRALLHAGLYAAVTLPKHPSRSAGAVCVVGDAALHGAAVDLLHAAWPAAEPTHSAHVSSTRGVASALGGFGLSWLEDVLQSAQQARIRIEPERESIEARVEIEPKPGGLLERMLDGLSPVDVSGLFVLPRASALAMVSPSSRGGPGIADEEHRVRALFGEQLNASERAVVSDALRALKEARGDYMGYALLAGAEPEFVLSGPVRDAAKFEAALGGLARALEFPAVAAQLRELAGIVRAERDTTAVSGIARRVPRVRMTLGSVKARATETQGKAQRLEWLWLAHEGRGYAAVGTAPARVLQGLLAARDTPDAAASAGQLDAGDTLDAHAELRALATQSAADIGFAAVVDPVRLQAAGAGASGTAPIFVGLARSGRSGVLRIAGSRKSFAALVDAFAVP